MITSRDFDRCTYKKPRLIDDRDPVSNLIGIDSEAYGVDAEGHRKGEPFMFCTSLGDVWRPDDLPDMFFTPRYHYANFIVYNLKYDSGAFLYHLPVMHLRELRVEGSTWYMGRKYDYIPHKLLRIREGKITVCFWDVSQFYRMSLDKASKTYLGRNKLDIRTKKFTPKYVRRFWKYISRYCILDAKLTADLGKHLVNKLIEFGITPTTLYSEASVSFTYFCANANVITSWKLWHENREALALACDAYEGGKFEVTTRGHFDNAFEYDLVSAYPYEIANLVDISHARVSYDTKYHKEAVYGFLRCRIENPTGISLPCGIMRNNVRIYPAGTYYLTITKEEYEYLCTLDINVEIIRSVWFFVRRKRYPYRKTVYRLFDIKSQYKGKDRMLFSVSKYVMNGFYGKHVQCIEQPNGKVAIGSGWNPVYGAVITANTRIKVTKMQNLLKDDCLAVHTDSVISARKLGKRYIRGGLGNFETVEGAAGEGVIIACGMYQIGKANAFKGFRPKDGETWLNILTKYRRRKAVLYKQLHVESWLEAMAKGHEPTAINVFERSHKLVDLNCDTKRIWTREVTGQDLLDGLEPSLPKVHVEIETPKHWKE
jgi:hypothetical protein